MACDKRHKHHCLVTIVTIYRAVSGVEESPLLDDVRGLVFFTHHLPPATACSSVPSKRAHVCRLLLSGFLFELKEGVVILPDRGAGTAPGHFHPQFVAEKRH